MYFKKKILKMNPRDILFLNGILASIFLIIFHMWWILPINVLLYLLQIYVKNNKENHSLKN